MRTSRFNLGGYELALTDRGEGGPAIVFVSGLGEPGTVWDTVQSMLTVKTARITYDRAGTGASDLLPDELRDQPQSALWLVDQLRQLLRSGGIASPFVLAGHSIGGWVADLFAAHHPDEVAAAVLVDASSWSSDTGMPRPVYIDGAEPGGLPIDRDASRDHIGAVTPSTDIPVVVIGSAPWRWLRSDHAEDYLPHTLDQIDQRWQRHQLALAERWQGHLVLPHDAGHRVHEEAPGLVAAVLDSVVHALRADRPVALDQEVLNAAGGSLRVSSTTGLGLRVWTPAAKVR